MLKSVCGQGEPWNEANKDVGMGLSMISCLGVGCDPLFIM